MTPPAPVTRTPPVSPSVALTPLPVTVLFSIRLVEVLL